MKKLINTTPHEINIYNDDDKLVVSLPKSADPIRCETARVEKTGESFGFSLYVTELGDVLNPPPANDGNTYIVSGMVRQKLQQDNLWQPGKAKRDNDGRVIGCYGLSQ